MLHCSYNERIRPLLLSNTLILFIFFSFSATAKQEEVYLYTTFIDLQEEIKELQKQYVTIIDLLKQEEINLESLKKREMEIEIENKNNLYRQNLELYNKQSKEYLLKIIQQKEIINSILDNIHFYKVNSAIQIKNIDDINFSLKKSTDHMTFLEKQYKTISDKLQKTKNVNLLKKTEIQNLQKKIKAQKTHIINSMNKKQSFSKKIDAKILLKKKFEQINRDLVKIDTIPIQKHFLQKETIILSPITDETINYKKEHSMFQALINKNKVNIIAPISGQIIFKKYHSIYKNILIIDDKRGQEILITGISHTLLHKNQRVNRGGVLGYSFLNDTIHMYVFSHTSPVKFYLKKV